MINLLPPEVRSNTRIACNNTMLLRYVELLCLALLIVIVAYIISLFFLGVQQHNVQTVVDSNSKTVARLAGVQKEATQLSTTINTIAGLLSREVTFSQMISQTSALLPQGSVLTGLQFSIEDLKSPLVISAQVDTESKAAILLKNLQSTRLFEDTQLVSISKIKEDSTATTPVVPVETTPATPAAPTVPAVPVSPYKYDVVINAYLKPDAIGAKQ